MSRTARCSNPPARSAQSYEDAAYDAAPPRRPAPQPSAAADDATADVPYARHATSAGITVVAWPARRAR